MQPNRQPDDVRTALAACVEEIRRAPAHARAETFSAACHRMGGLVSRDRTEAGGVIDALQAAADACGLTAEVGQAAVAAIGESALNSGLGAGCLPVLVRRVADVVAEPIRWLWRNRLALGKLALLAGHPGLGKSQLATWLAAMVSTGGTLPGDAGRAPQGSVLMLSAEDDIADTVRPRLEAAGADLTRVHAIDAAGTPNSGLRRRIDLSSDIATLDALASRIGDVRLVVIDPLTAYVGRLDSSRQSTVRALLQPIAAFAARHDAAVLGITHLNKAGSGAMTRVAGSLAYVAAARAAYLVVPDGDGERRLMLPLKNNLGDDRAGLAFRIARRTLAGGIESSAVAWDDGLVAVSAEQALAAAARTRKDDGALAEAAAFLREVLGSGPVAANDAKAQAVEAGISAATLRRARQDMGVRPRYTGTPGVPGQWLWGMPD